jgi:DNA-binding transcriptional ArsR family regulator
MTALYKSRDQAVAAVERLRLYAQPQRLMILSFLLAGEQSVGTIEAETGISQPALSQQLSELRRAGLVATRRTAKQVHYRLAGDFAALCVRSIETLFADDRDADNVFISMPAVRKSQKNLPQKDGAAAFAKLV